MRPDGTTKEYFFSISTKIGLFFLAALVLATCVGLHSVSAAVLDVTNAEKLSLPTTTPVGQRVRITDALMIAGGTGSEDEAIPMNGVYLPRYDISQFMTDFAASKIFLKVGDQGKSESTQVLFRRMGGSYDGKWILSNEAGMGAWAYSNENNLTDPTLATWSFFTAGVGTPIVTHTTPIQELIAPSSTLSAVFISGAGTVEANGIYTERGAINGKPYYNLLGVVDDWGVSVIKWDGAEWAIYGSDTGSFYSSTQDVSFPWLVTAWVNDSTETGDGGLLPVPTASSITQGELNAGVTVAGSLTSTSNGIYLNGASYVGFPKYTNGDNYIRMQFDHAQWVLYDSAIDDTSEVSNANLDSGSFPWAASSWYGTSVTRNDVASEANWIISSIPVPTKLSFTVQPSSAAVGSVISPAVSVRILDASSTLDSDATSTVTLSIGNNPGGGTLSGTLSKAAIAGVATFNDLSINNAAVGYTLIASSTGLTSTTSTAFTINALASNGGGNSGGGGVAPQTGGSGGASYLPPVKPATSTPQLSSCLPGDLYSRETGNPCSTLTSTTTTTFIPPPFDPSLFTRNLTLGSHGEDVRQLQIFLNSEGFIIASSGPGSPGNETTFFGLLTRAALVRFQTTHGISPSVGYFGPITRAVILLLLGS